jgi:hypothetical protein
MGTLCPLPTACSPPLSLEVASAYEIPLIYLHFFVNKSITVLCALTQ